MNNIRANIFSSRRLLVFYDRKEAQCNQLYMLHGYPRAKFCQESLSYGINSMLYNVGNQIWSQLFIDHQQDTNKIFFSLSNIWIFYIILDFPCKEQMQHAFQWKMRPKPQMETRSWEQQSFHRLLRHVLSLNNFL